MGINGDLRLVEDALARNGAEEGSEIRLALERLRGILRTQESVIKAQRLSAKKTADAQAYVIADLRKKVRELERKTRS